MIIIIHIYRGSLQLSQTLSNIEVTGMYTHLSFFFGKPEHINVQYNKFQKTVELMKEKGVKTEMLHICISAFLRFPICTWM